MPNHVVNELIWDGITPEQRSAILANAVNGEGKIDFTILLPVPLNAWMGSVGTNHEEAFKITALDWCRQHWGTKWNAYSQLPIEDEAGRLRLVFETAWRPPYGWLAALLNRFRLPFAHNWHDEGREVGRVGRFWVGAEDTGLWDAGPQWREQDAEGEMQRHLHKLQWGVEEWPADQAAETEQ